MKYKTDETFLSFTVLMIFHLVMSSFLFLSYFVGGGEGNQPINNFKFKKTTRKKITLSTVHTLFKFSFYAIKLQTF